MIIRCIPRRRLPPHIRWLDYRVERPDSVVSGEMLMLPLRGGSVPGVVLETGAVPDIPESRIKTIATLRRLGKMDRASLAALVVGADFFHVPLPAMLLALMPEPPKRAATEELPTRPDLPHSKKLDPSRVLLRHRGDSDAIQSYIRFLNENLADGTAMVIAPDISRAQFIKGQCAAAGLRTSLYHHGLSKGLAWQEWNSLATGKARVLVTTRSGVLAPSQDLKAIIVDSEDDGDYIQRDAFPYFDVRQLAEGRAMAARSALLLASETPRFSTVWQAHENGWIITAPAEQTVDVRFVPLRQEPRKLSEVRLSGALIDASQTAVQSGFSVLCFLNRAVESKSVRCAECRRPLQCTACNAVLAVRQRSLTCPRCAQNQAWPDVCPACQSPRLEERTPGIPRVRTALEAHLGQPVVAMTRESDSVELPAGVCVILATETIWKNCAPLIRNRKFGLVAALEADMGLSAPSVTAVEDVWSTLMRLRNLAGQSECPLILQAWQDEHPVFNSVRNGQPGPILTAELADRSRYGYPPFGNMWRAYVPAADAQHAEQTIRKTLPEADVIPEEPRGLIRRAVRGHASFLLKLPISQKHNFTSLPNSWILEPDPRP